MKILFIGGTRDGKRTRLPDENLRDEVEMPKVGKPDEMETYVRSGSSVPPGEVVYELKR